MGLLPVAGLAQVFPVLIRMAEEKREAELKPGLRDSSGRMRPM